MLAPWQIEKMRQEKAQQEVRQQPRLEIPMPPPAHYQAPNLKETTTDERGSVDIGFGNVDFTL